MSEKTSLKRLLLNMHCSRCKNEFEENDIQVMRNESGLLVFQIKCENCKKCFGMAFLGLGSKEFIKSVDFDNENINDKKEPINYDDVLDAHHFFQNLDENWSKYIK